jgi:hypothetical protein
MGKLRWGSVGRWGLWSGWWIGFGLALPAQLLTGPNLDRWLAEHGAEGVDFSHVYVRFCVEKPADLRYYVVVDSETNPYRPEWYATGTVTAKGRRAPEGDPKSLNWAWPDYPPQEPDDYLQAGQYSVWVPLPSSTAAQWHTAFWVKPAPGQSLGDGVRLHLEFSIAPEPDRVFHIVDELTDTAGVAAVRAGRSEPGRTSAVGEFHRMGPAAVSDGAGPPPRPAAPPEAHQGGHLGATPDLPQGRRIGHPPAGRAGVRRVRGPGPQQRLGQRDHRRDVRRDGPLSRDHRHDPDRLGRELPLRPG